MASHYNNIHDKVVVKPTARLKRKGTTIHLYYSRTSQIHKIVCSLVRWKPYMTPVAQGAGAEGEAVRMSEPT